MLAQVATVRAGRYNDVDGLGGLTCPHLRNSLLEAHIQHLDRRPIRKRRRQRLQHLIDALEADRNDARAGIRI